MADFDWNNWQLLVIILMMLAAVALYRLFRGREEFPYTRRKKLMTRSEIEFFRVLRDAVNNDWEIFAMVRIADLLAVPGDTGNQQSWLNRILSKHVDFVICDRDSLEILVAIELDDASHSRPDRVERDAFVNDAFADARLPLLRIPVSDSYDKSRLRRSIEDAISGD